VTDEDVEAFKALGLLHARVSREGDTRYDQVLARLSSPKPLQEIPTPRPLFVCGSTWTEDEEILVPAIAQMPEICGVLVPHEPTPSHLEELEDRIRKAGLEPVRYSTLKNAGELGSRTCVVVDQIGILAELYLKGRWAFVGGSFRKTVHSVMEPLAAGCVTFVGPLHTNNREAVSFQSLNVGAVSAVTCVRCSEELVTKLRAAPEAAGDAIREAVRARTGSSQKIVDWIKGHL